jgi:hypothetical protein
MLDTLFNLLEQRGTWRAVALLFILFLLCTQGFEWRRKTLGFENPALDGRRWYSPAEARDFLQNIGERGRRLYAVTELTLDLLFPIIYGALFSILLIHVYARGTAKNLLLVPLMTVVADVAENLTTAYLALQFDGQESSLARVAATFTMVKSVLLLLSLILILFGVVWPYVAYYLRR